MCLMKLITDNSTAIQAIAALTMAGTSIVMVSQLVYTKHQIKRTDYWQQMNIFLTQFQYQTLRAEERKLNSVLSPLHLCFGDLTSPAQKSVQDFLAADNDAFNKTMDFMNIMSTLCLCIENNILEEKLTLLMYGDLIRKSYFSLGYIYPPNDYLYGLHKKYAEKYQKIQNPIVPK